MTESKPSEGRHFPTFRAAPWWFLTLPWRLARWIGRLWRRTWRYVAPFVAVLLVAHLVLNIVAGHKLEKELAYIRAQGQPLTLEEAAPPKVPDSQNAAVLYLKAFKGLEDKNDQEIFHRALPGRPIRIRAATVPPPTHAELEAVVARHEADFRLLKQASLRPACRFPVNWSAGFEALFPHQAGVRNAARFLVAKALVDSRRGQSGQALDDLAIVIRMTNHTSTEPTLIAQLVRFAVIAIVSASLPDVLAAAPPDEAQSRAFYDTLARVDMVGPLVHAMQGERCFGLSMYDYVRRTKSLELARAITSEWEPGTRDSWLLSIGKALVPLAKALWGPVLKLDEAYFLREWRRFLPVAGEPYRKSIPVYEQWERQERLAPPYYILFRILTPVLGRGAEARDKGIAIIGMMQAAMALRDYQIKHGEYPASLAELRAAGGATPRSGTTSLRSASWPIPDDPFSGKPFIYRREGAGYLIYSVAEDFQDNGGIDKNAAMIRHRNQPGTVQYDLPLRMTR